MRTIVNLIGIWANNSAEATYFGDMGLDGGTIYTQNFSKEELPKAKAHYFWSVIAVDSNEYHVIENPMKRYLLNKQSPLLYNPDGSLTLVYGPSRPKEYPETNWLPTKTGERYNLTFRFYGPSDDISEGRYFPPALVEMSEMRLHTP
jgi:hypothetical protein